MERIIGPDLIEEERSRCRIILDVRSPVEFDEDHLAGACNVPVLTNDQRAEVGALYRENPFAARKQGARYALQAIDDFLGTAEMQRAQKNTRILIYCARGGLRSASMAMVLTHIGFPIARLEKGYKTYRRHVLNILARDLPQPVYVLHGFTGSGKTRILHHLASEFNILDLEACAAHRGSLLGALPHQAQPTQRGFETRLLEQIRAFDPAKPTLIEGESRKVGRSTVPNPIWDQMTAGRHLWLEVPRTVRIDHILAEYSELQDPTHFEPHLKRLAPYLARKVMSALTDGIAAGDWARVVEILLQYHYDPLYRRVLGKGHQHRLQAANIEQACARIRAVIAGHLEFHGIAGNL
jgi:tRNA 2-selenouridine synthase